MHNSYSNMRNAQYAMGIDGTMVLELSSICHFRGKMLQTKLVLIQSCILIVLVLRRQVRKYWNPRRLVFLLKGHAIKNVSLSHVSTQCQPSPSFVSEL